MKHIAYAILLSIICMTLISCIKTTDKLITARELCADKEKFSDPDDFRDPYDECMLFTDEHIRTQKGCGEVCTAYCTKHDMIRKETWTDIAGCRCICKLNLSQK